MIPSVSRLHWLAARVGTGARYPVPTPGELDARCRRWKRNASELPTCTQSAPTGVAQAGEILSRNRPHCRLGLSRIVACPADGDGGAGRALDDPLASRPRGG